MHLCPVPLHFLSHNFFCSCLFTHINVIHVHPCHCNSSNQRQGVDKSLTKQSPNVQSGFAMKFFLTILIFHCMARAMTLAQEIGVDICACQPAVYEFTLDFDLTCDDLSVGGPGVRDKACLVEMRGIDNQDGADLRPVAVNNVQIFELGQNLQVTAQTPLAGNFLSGSIFTYTSIVVTAPNTMTSETLPRGLQLVFTGINALDQTVVNTFIILYTNDCGIRPVLQKGQIAGWTAVSDLEKPSRLLCPSLTAEPSSAPTLSMVPSTRPSQSPTISMIPTISIAPTTSPSLSPSFSSAPTMTQQPLPTTMIQPSQPPSIAPSIGVTDPPEVTASPTNYQKMTMMGMSKGKGKVRNDGQRKKEGKGSLSAKRGRSSSSKG